MSVKLMGAVFELDIPRDPKFVLLAMADPAADDGSNSYLSIETISKKTSMSVRGVQTILRRLLVAQYVQFVGKVHVKTKSRVSALRGETIEDFRARDGFGHGFTAEYRLTLDQGVKELLNPKNPAPGAPFGSQRTLQLGAKNPARHDVETPQLKAKNPAPGAGESLRTKVLTKNGTGRLEGGGCQDAESSAESASAIARAFAAFNLGSPYGHVAFQAVVAKHSQDLQERNLIDAMESVIQDCQQTSTKVPPQFYEAKHRLEQEIRDAQANRDALTGNQDRYPDPRDHSEAFRSYISQNADKIEKLATDRRYKAVRVELKATAKALRTLLESECLDVEATECKLVELETTLRTIVSKSMTPALTAKIKKDAQRELERYRGKLAESHISQIHQTILDQRIFEAFGVPRLSLYYCTV
jgi:hypothetical protein